MTFAYSGNPGQSTLDQVRFLLGDTVDETHVLEDEEITWLLSENADDPYYAAAGGAIRLSIKATNQAEETKRVGDLELTRRFTASATHWQGLAQSIRDMRPGDGDVEGGGALPWVSPLNYQAPSRFYTDQFKGN